MNESSNSVDVFQGLFETTIALVGVLLLALFSVVIMLRVNAAATKAMKAQLNHSIEKRVEGAKRAAVNKQRFSDELNKTRLENENHKRENKKLENERKRAQQRADRAEKHGETLTKENSQLKGTVAKHTAKNDVTLVVVVDCSASMSHAIEELLSTVKQLVSSLPRALDKFRMGIVLFRGGKVVTLPIEEVVPAEQDQGVSQARVVEFVDRVRAKSGSANIIGAVEEAMAMLEIGASVPGSKKCLFVLGDSAREVPAEAEAAFEYGFFGRLKSWANDTDYDRRVLALYCRQENHLHRDFFENLAAVNSKSVFSSNTADMFAAVFDAAFGE